MKRHFTIPDIIVSIILLLLVYTAFSKLVNYGAFKFVLSRSPLLKPYSSFIAWLLPGAELVISILLFIPVTRLKGLFASGILISSFTLYLVYMISYSPDLPCACGGVLKNLSWRQHIIFNLFFIVIAGVGIQLYKKHRKIARHEGPP